MRDEHRIKSFMQELERVWARYPDLRFGQLVENVVVDMRKLWSLEEEQFLELLHKFEDRLS